MPTNEDWEAMDDFEAYDKMQKSEAKSGSPKVTRLESAHEAKKEKARKKNWNK